MTRTLAVLMLAALLVAGCKEVFQKPLLAPAPASKLTTFEEVSAPYRERYGAPEDEYRYDSDDYHSVDWWWWTKGFEVSFVNSPYDDWNGWRVDSEYHFPPIL